MPRDTGNDNIDLKQFPPLPPDELRGAYGYDNIDRVVVTRSGVYGLASGGGWIKFQPQGHIPAS